MARHTSNDESGEDQPPLENLTDVGNARRLVHRHGPHIKYVAKLGKWLVYDGKRFAVDERGEITRRAKETARSLYIEAQLEGDDGRRARLASHAIKTESEPRLRAMVKLAQSEHGIPVLPDELDVDPWLLNVKNGTLDLRTGELRSHSPTDLITKLAPVEYSASAAAPTWNAFIHRICGDSDDLLRFIQLAAGYSLTGAVSEQAFFVMHGAGANGKSTYLEVLKSVLGDYAMSADINTFLASKKEGARNDIARLRGARFVSAAEAGEGRRLDESLIKTVTGGDTVNARFLFCESFEYRPSFKLFLATNHKPVIRGTEYAIWRRVLLIPFSVTIPASEQDKHLTEKLCAEAPGILRWAVDGCLAWQRLGCLPRPAIVQAATDEYRKESDELGPFLDECCELHEDARELAAAVYGAYREWAVRSGEAPMTNTKFGRLLNDRGLVSQKMGVGKQRVTWRVGLKLVTQLGQLGQFSPKVLHEGDYGESTGKTLPTRPSPSRSDEDAEAERHAQQDAA